MKNKASNANSGDTEMRQRIPRPKAYISDFITFLQLHEGKGADAVYYLPA